MTEQLTLSLVAEHWALGSVGFVVAVRGHWSTGSVVVVHEPTCSEAYGIIPDGIEAESPALAGRVLYH